MFRAIASDKATTMGHINRKHLDIAEVIIPEKLTKDQKKLFESLKNTELDNSPEFKKYYKFLKK